MSDSYHLDELRIALDRADPAHELPPAMPEGAKILDIGCGAGQTMIGAYPDRLTFGMDVDLDALRLGRSLTQAVAFVCGRAEELPYGDGRFDLVVARVSLTYTNIPKSLAEIRRVLRAGGVVWMTLHPLSMCWTQARNGSWKGKFYFAYVALNGLSLHLCGKQFRLGRRQESFQTTKGITRALERAGFRDIRVAREPRFVVTARV